MIAFEERSLSTPSSERLSLRALLSGRKKSSCGLGAAQRPDAKVETSGKLDNILVATNFSDASANAVSLAAALARQRQATLTILHIIDINSPSSNTFCGSAEALMEQLWAAGIRELALLKKSLEEKQTKVRTLLVEGIPCEAIAETSSGFDLLIVGEPDSKPGWNFFSRRTARRLVEQAKCPVLMVEKGWNPVSREFEPTTEAAA